MYIYVHICTCTYLFSYLKRSKHTANRFIFTFARPSRWRRCVCVRVCVCVCVCWCACVVKSPCIFSHVQVCASVHYGCVLTCVRVRLFVRMCAHALACVFGFVFHLLLQDTADGVLVSLCMCKCVRVLCVCVHTLVHVVGLASNSLVQDAAHGAVVCVRVHFRVTLDLRVCVFALRSLCLFTH